ncbi:glycosyl transferase, putative [Talaromyces stipitatus ATCC 10500]|uniref:Glycosyl transferase, putative n=1 Tax=Talaromyces stipitatus (strain ATCC 10500 / CBS 375.48 / QM 6759 / NRRL 1006) TaxID=441959 RepID=B8MPU5_TALSN|nr:glycosyl transferase, putative [Talaromyces stipitatus ATCC 10500]EED12753.1 glycosyl transferase, putative [Talaromyces stipitatus ATCC 10500]
MLSKHEYDILELPPDDHIRFSLKYRKALYFISQAAIWAFQLYFLVRLLLVITTPQQTWQIWLMLLVEYIFARIPRHDQFLTVSASKSGQSRPRDRLRLLGNDHLPRVNVLIPCCGEPTDVVLDTVHAACSMDYPTIHFRVLLLDDGASNALRDAVASLRSQWPHLSYHTRGQQSGRVFAKAGNLNYALFELQPEAQPEFCAVLDADCVPKSDFLRATLPHLLRDPQAALLTTRQYYYNLPDGDSLQQSRAHFYTCHNSELDRMAAAIDAGSGAVFRRKAIVDVGGYPTFSFSEDWQLSLMLQGLGYRTLQVLEPLQFGLVPSSLDGHIAQRNRWQLGHSQQPSVLFSDANQAIPRHLQWSITFNGVLIILGLVGYMVGFAAVPILFASGNLIPASSSLIVQIQVVLAVLHVALTWTHGLVQAAHTGFRIAPFAHLENSWLASTHILAIIRFHCVSNKPKGSFVTGSSANSWNRMMELSKYKKLRKDLLNNGLLYSVFLFFAILSTFLLSFYGALSSDYAAGSSTTPQTLLMTLLTTVAWPPMLHIAYLALSNLWIPVAYLLQRPEHPERRSRMVTHATGIFLPREDVQMKLLQHSLPPLGYLNHYILVPVVLITIFTIAVTM